MIKYSLGTMFDVIFNVLYLSRSMLKYNSIHGGKKSEKAKALGNTRDTGSNKLRCKFVVYQPMSTLVGEKLNS